jgi:hypothetical protein
MGWRPNTPLGMDNTNHTEATERMIAGKISAVGTAYARGWRSAKETEAFNDGVRWLLAKMIQNFEILPK